MKVYIKENKLQLLKESEDEVTFYGFFTQVKNFMKQLLTNPADATPSDVLKAHGLGRKELITKLTKRGLLKSKENITEVPNGEENGKLRAKHTIQYSVPKQDFEKKFHRLYTELFENEWKPKSVLSNEDEEIKKILNNDTDGAYHKRGGYKLSESLNNQDAPLYHYTSVDNFFQIIKTGLKPSFNDGVQCVSFARSKELDLEDSFNKEVDVRMMLDPHKLDIPRKCTTAPFQAVNYEDEFEERIYRTDGKDFMIKNVKESLIQVDVLIIKGWGEYNRWRSMLDAIEYLFEGNTDIFRFYINYDDFVYGWKKESYDLETTKQYLEDFLYKPHNDGSRRNLFATIQRAEKIDKDDDKKEQQDKQEKEGREIASYLVEIITDYFNNRYDLFTTISFKGTDPIERGLAALSSWENVSQIVKALNNLTREQALSLYWYYRANEDKDWSIDKRIGMLIQCLPYALDFK